MNMPSISITIDFVRPPNINTPTPIYKCLSPPPTHAEMPVHVPRNPPLPATLPARSRWQLLEEAFQPIRRNTGTTYPCTASELKDATTPSRRPARRPVSKHQASYSIQAHNALGNHLSHEDYAAICRLENATLGVFAGRYWSPDLIIKAFCDLDRVFFLGHLRGHVYVRWRSQRSFPQRIPHRLTMGRTDYLGGGKAVIYLNADGIFADTAMSAFKEMWRTLLHEMW